MLQGWTHFSLVNLQHNLFQHLPVLLNAAPPSQELHEDDPIFLLPQRGMLDCRVRPNDV